jgi:hypothetical protein
MMILLMTHFDYKWIIAWMRTTARGASRGFRGFEQPGPGVIVNALSNCSVSCTGGNTAASELSATFHLP